MKYFYYSDQAQMLYYLRADFEEITKDLETFKKHMTVYPIEGEMLDSFAVWEECEQLLCDLPKTVSRKNTELCKKVVAELLKLKKQTCWSEKIEYVMSENGKVDFKNAEDALDAYRKYLLKCHKNASCLKPQVPLKERLELIKKDVNWLK